MSNLTIKFTDTLVVITCWCGINHAVPEDLRNYQQRCHDNGTKVPDIYCPLGHSHVPSGKGAAAIAQERLAKAERAIANREEDLRAERASHVATKGQLTKARKRAAAGVCPCCKRTFVDVARHVATRHPEQLEQTERQLP